MLDQINNNLAINIIVVDSIIVPCATQRGKRHRQVYSLCQATCAHAMLDEDDDSGNKARAEMRAKNASHNKQSYTTTREITDNETLPMGEGNTEVLMD